MAPKVVLLAFIACCFSIATMAQYVGCCLDHSATDLPFKLYVGNTTTNSACSSWCYEAGYAYSGTQNGNECWCGNQYCTVASLDSSSCNKVCAGNPNSATEKCGGLAINSVTRTPAAFLGCFNETEDRELAYRGPDTSDPTACMAFCNSAGYRFAGMQYWNQCWCGNSYGKYGKLSLPSAECVYCGSLFWQMCGKAYKNAIYRV